MVLSLNVYKAPNKSLCFICERDEHRLKRSTSMAEALLIRQQTSLDGFSIR